VPQRVASVSFGKYLMCFDIVIGVGIGKGVPLLQYYY